MTRETRERACVIFRERTFLREYLSIDNTFKLTCQYGNGDKS